MVAPLGHEAIRHAARPSRLQCHCAKRQANDAADVRALRRCVLESFAPCGFSGLSAMINATSGSGVVPEPLALSLFYFRFCLRSLPARALRPDDHPAIRSIDALPDQRTVGAVGIVFIPPPTVVIARPHAEAEGADLNAGAVRVNAAINLRRGRNRRDDQRAGSDGE